MTVTIHVFASLRERLGKSSWKESIPEGTDTGMLVAMLAGREVDVAAVQSVIRVAVNDQWVSTPVQLNDGDDVALLTPVSGG